MTRIEYKIITRIKDKVELFIKLLIRLSLIINNEGNSTNYI